MEERLLTLIEDSLRGILRIAEAQTAAALEMATAAKEMAAAFRVEGAADLHEAAGGEGFDDGWQGWAVAEEDTAKLNES